MLLQFTARMEILLQSMKSIGGIFVNNILAIILWFLLWYFVALRGMMYLIIDICLIRVIARREEKGKIFLNGFFILVTRMLFRWRIKCIFILVLLVV